MTRKEIEKAALAALEKVTRAPKNKPHRFGQLRIPPGVRIVDRSVVFGSTETDGPVPYDDEDSGSFDGKI